MFSAGGHPTNRSVLQCSSVHWGPASQERQLGALLLLSLFPISPIQSSIVSQAGYLSKI